MSKSKNKIGVFSILKEGFSLYFKNFKIFMKYMTFPVLGQILGLSLTLYFAYLYTQNLPYLIEKFQIFNNFSIIFTVLILIISIPLFLFMKAFWEYLVAYGAISSMTANAIKSGKVYDIQAHTELIKRRTFKYILLWLLFSIFLLIGYFPLFWIIAIILFIYFILIFQVFTLEEDKSPIKCFKRSFEIIKGHFAITLGLALVLYLITFVILPDIVKFIAEIIQLISLLVIPFDIYVRQLPFFITNSSIPIFNFEITSLMLAGAMAKGFIGFIIIAYTLPLRSICYTILYKKLAKFEPTIDKKLLKRATDKKEI